MPNAMTYKVVEGREQLPRGYRRNASSSPAEVRTRWSSTTTSGIYCGPILNENKPADLAMQQSTKVEPFINLKTAKALEITVPPTLPARADEAIE